MVAVLAQLEAVSTPEVDWAGLLPVVLPAAGALVLLMVRSLVPSRLLPAALDAAWTFAVAVAGLVTVAVLWQRDGEIRAFGDQLVMDGLALFVAAVVLGSVALVAPTLPRYCRRVGVVTTELCVLVLLAAAGAVVMAGAADLIVLFLGLETMSIAAYVMGAQPAPARVAGGGPQVLRARRLLHRVPAVRIALVYGATGTTNLHGIGLYLDTFIVLRDGCCWRPGHAAGGPGLQGGGRAVPCVGARRVRGRAHAGDGLYGLRGEGGRVRSADPSVRGSAGGAGRRLAASRVRPWPAPRWRSDPCWPRSKATPSASWLTRPSPTRVFILVGVQAASDSGVAAVLFYLAAYAVIAVGSFTVVAVLSGPGDDRTGLASLAGLGTRRPALALGLTILLLAQAGVPFTSGFVGQVLGHIGGGGGPLVLAGRGGHG